MRQVSRTDNPDAPSLLPDPPHRAQRWYRWACPACGRGGLLRGFITEPPVCHCRKGGRATRWQLIGEARR